VNNVLPLQTLWLAGNNQGWCWSWYPSVLPQLEQQPIFNAINFSVNCQGAEQTTAGYNQLSFLICPSEDQKLRPSAYGTSNYAGNFGGPGTIGLWSGTIVPNSDQLGGTLSLNGRGVANLGPVGFESIKDGMSSTALFSERLIGLNGGPTITRNSDDAKRAIFTSATTVATGQGAAGAKSFIDSCNALAPSTTSTSTNLIAYCWIYGYPMHVGINAYMHYGQPNSIPCHNPSDPSWLSYVGPQGYASANSNHSGGVNLTMADGSVKFIKDSINLQTWWGLGTRKGGEVISADAY